MDMAKVSKYRASANERVARVLQPFVEAFDKIDDPGVSDLDNEQPMTLRVTLGALRRARTLYRQITPGF